MKKRRLLRMRIDVTAHGAAAGSGKYIMIYNSHRYFCVVRRVGPADCPCRRARGAGAMSPIAEENASYDRSEQYKILKPLPCLFL